MNINSKIYIAGHRGMVGSAIIRQLATQGITNIITRTHAELDLCDQYAVRQFMQAEKPDYIVLAAAKVGGIHANNTYPAEFIYQNMMIEANVIHEAYSAGIHKLLFLGSSCIYPKFASQPMSESELLSGILEQTNEPYAIAKIAGIKLCESYNRQYGTDYRSVMPTNLYGPGDNYHLENSHVVPAIIRKIHLAKCLEENNWQAIKNDRNKNPIKNINKNSTKEEIINALALYGINSTFNISNEPTFGKNSKLHTSVSIWGSGKVKREFLHVDDMAAASVFVMQLDKVTYQENTKPMLSHINVGTGEDVTIAELAQTVKAVVGFEGELVFDAEKPEGTPRKLLDVNRINGMGWKASISLTEGLLNAYDDYKSHL